MNRHLRFFVMISILAACSFDVQAASGSTEQAENIYEQMLIARNIQDISVYEGLLSEDALITLEETRAEAKISTYTKNEYIDYRTRIFRLFSPPVSTEEEALGIVNEYDNYSVTTTKLATDDEGFDHYSVVSTYSLNPLAQVRVDKEDTYTIRFREEMGEITAIYFKTTYSRIP